MRNFKDIIIEKLKVTKNDIELPDLEDFKMAIYNFNTGHEIIFEEIDPKYKDIKNCPEYKLPGTVYYIASLYVTKRMNSEKLLFAACYENISPTTSNHSMINSMNRLIELLGEELVLQIWDYIR